MNLEPQKYYHIYNHATGNANLFREARNYIFFMQKCHHYLHEIADFYAWCLMSNHFHFLIRIKDEKEIRVAYETKNLQGLATNKKTCKDLEGFKSDFNEAIASKFISQQFSNFFNSYTKSYNKVYATFGNLFNHTFYRKELPDEESFMRVLLYIHNNPVKHGFTQRIPDWEYSSYHAYLNEDYSVLERGALSELFTDKDNFVLSHSRAGLIEADLDLEFENE